MRMRMAFIALRATRHGKGHGDIRHTASPLLDVTVTFGNGVTGWPTTPEMVVVDFAVMAAARMFYPIGSDEHR